MLLHHRAAPDPALRTVVRHFAQRECADAHRHVPPFALPARTEQFIEFYLRDVYHVSLHGGPPEAVPQIAVVGAHCTPGKQLHMMNDIRNFTVVFTATGFHRLFGVPMAPLRDTAVLATDVLPPAVWEWYGALQRAQDFAERVQISTQFLGRQLEAARGDDAIDAAARRLVRSGGLTTVTALADEVGCSERQLHRTFTERAGLAPKLYARITRFHALLAAHDRSPKASLSALAYDAGYFDQAHFNRDCRAFTGAPPSGFLADWASARQRRP